MQPSDYLQPLVAPLRFLAQSDFLRVSTVKGLGPLVEAALVGARREGDATDVRLLERAAEALQGSDVESTRVALRALARRVSGPVAPAASPEAPDPARPPPAPPPAPPPDRAAPSAGSSDGADARVERSPATSVASRRPAAPRPTGGSPGLFDAAPAPARRRSAASSGRSRARRAEEEVEAIEVEEARPLSISPRSGPLAQPLAGSGIRVPPRLVEALQKKGLHRVGDLLFLLPRLYEDRRRLQTLRELRPGERGVAMGTVRMARDLMIRPGKRGFQAVLADETGSIALTWFQTGPWMKSRVPVGKRLIVSGELRATPNGREMIHPELEPAEPTRGPSLHVGRIVPVYPGFERHEQRQVRELVARAAAAHLGAVEDPLPPALRQRLGLLGLGEALGRLHQPGDEDSVEALDARRSPSHRRLAFDELFFLHLGMSLRRQGVKSEPGIAFQVDGDRLATARSLLPFQLTRAQARAVAEIGRDMSRSEPMHRLLQGDVGSGKTAVAAVAAALAVQDGWQVALMAPTEILAAQHHATFQRVFQPMDVEVALVTGSGPGSGKRSARGAVESGQARVAVGTQALIQEGVAFQRLGLVLIDEQHRFGVLQRQALGQKGLRPDVLVMTATPIPRTLAMTLYGDLDLSVLDELPPGRTPITTRVARPHREGEVWEAVEMELRKGRQAYVLYPLVEASEKIDLADATRGAEELAARWPDRAVALLHGRLRQEEKDRTMESFRAGLIDVLVCTTVVEVGVDVANASVMVVQNAERFGLSQLHQLRGRVGRGAAKSYCYLMPAWADGAEAQTRLEVLEQSTDGFVIAEKDLELRGPGEFLGTRQSGLPELSVANLGRDQALSAVAAEEARAIAEADPRLQGPEHRSLVRALEERWEGRLALARVG